MTPQAECPDVSEQSEETTILMADGSPSTGKVSLWHSQRRIHWRSQFRHGSTAWTLRRPIDPVTATRPPPPDNYRMLRGLSRDTEAARASPSTLCGSSSTTFTSHNRRPQLPRDCNGLPASGPHPNGPVGFLRKPRLAERGNTDCLYYQINRCPNTRTDRRAAREVIFLAPCCGLIARVGVVGGTFA